MAGLRWFGRGQGGSHADEVDSAALTDLRTCHLLLVPSTTRPDHVAKLLRARIPDGDLVADGEIALGRHSRLVGPYQLTMETAVDAGVPMPWTVVYALRSPVEREDPPPADADDAIGLSFAFPQGMPWREERRGLHLIIGLARRLGGAVRVVGGEMMTPDPLRSVDFLIHAPHWMEPAITRRLVARVLPGARMAATGSDWTPPQDLDTAALSLHFEAGVDPMSTAEFRAISQAAQAYDVAALAAPPANDGYAIVADLDHGMDGEIEVLVRFAAGPVPAVAAEPWADRVVTYEVRWSYPDPQEHERNDPSPAFVESRGRVQPVVCAVARTLVEATSGVVTDEDGFLVDRYSL